jgi:hypothetical protein
MVMLVVEDCTTEIDYLDSRIVEDVLRGMPSRSIQASNICPSIDGGAQSLAISLQPALPLRRASTWNMIESVPHRKKRCQIINNPIPAPHTFRAINDVALC